MAMQPAEGCDPEQPVIDAIRGGDRYAFDELVRRHHPWVRGVIFGVLGDVDRVDDAAQQVWAALWERIGELRDVKRWRPWLYRLARNAAIDSGRDTRRRRQLAQAFATSRSAGSSGPADDRAVREEQHREVMTAIQALPALYREPFVLRHVNGWSYRRIGEMMNMPVDSVETRLVRARRFLRDSLKDRLG